MMSFVRHALLGAALAVATFSSLGAPATAHAQGCTISSNSSCSSTQNCTNLVVNAGRTLTMGNSCTYNVSGSVTINGAITMNGNSRLNLNQDTSGNCMLGSGSFAMNGTSYLMTRCRIATTVVQAAAFSVNSTVEWQGTGTIHPRVWTYGNLIINKTGGWWWAEGETPIVLGTFRNQNAAWSYTRPVAYEGRGMQTNNFTVDAGRYHIHDSGAASGYPDSNAMTSWPAATDIWIGGANGQASNGVANINGCLASYAPGHRYRLNSNGGQVHYHNFGAWDGGACNQYGETYLDRGVHSLSANWRLRGDSFLHIGWNNTIQASFHTNGYWATMGRLYSGSGSAWPGWNKFYGNLELYAGNVAIPSRAEDVVLTNLNVYNTANLLQSGYQSLVDGNLTVTAGAQLYLRGHRGDAANGAYINGVNTFTIGSGGLFEQDPQGYVANDVWLRQVSNAGCWRHNQNGDKNRIVIRNDGAFAGANQAFGWPDLDNNCNVFGHVYFGRGNNTLTTNLRTKTGGGFVHMSFDPAVDYSNLYTGSNWIITENINTPLANGIVDGNVEYVGSGTVTRKRVTYRNLTINGSFYLPLNADDGAGNYTYNQTWVSVNGGELRIKPSATLSMDTDQSYSGLTAANVIVEANGTISMTNSTNQPSFDLQPIGLTNDGCIQHNGKLGNRLVFLDDGNPTTIKPGTPNTGNGCNIFSQVYMQGGDYTLSSDLRNPVGGFTAMGWTPSHTTRLLTGSNWLITADLRTNNGGANGGFDGNIEYLGGTVALTNATYRNMRVSGATALTGAVSINGGALTVLNGGTLSLDANADIYSASSLNVNTGGVLQHTSNGVDTDIWATGDISIDGCLKHFGANNRFVIDAQVVHNFKPGVPDQGGAGCNRYRQIHHVRGDVQLTGDLTIDPSGFLLIYQADNTPSLTSRFYTNAYTLDTASLQMGAQSLFDGNVYWRGTTLPVGANVTYRNLTIDAASATLAGSTEVLGTLTVKAGRTFAVPAGVTLGIRGLTLESGANITFGAGSTIAIRGTGNLTLPALAYQNVIIDRASGTVGLAATTALAGSLTVSQGAFSTAGFALSANSIANSATVTINSGVTLTSTGTSLTNTGTITLATAADLDLAGSFSQSSGSTALQTASTLRVGGALAISAGTFTPNAVSTIVFDGATTQSIPALAYGNLTLANTSGNPVTPGASPLNIAGALNINEGAFSLTSGTVNVTGTTTLAVSRGLNITGTLNANGGFTGNGATIINGTGTLFVGGNLVTGGASTFTTFAGANIETTGTANFGVAPLLVGSTFTYSGGASQSVAAVAYHNLRINKSASAATLTGTTTASGTLNIDAGSLALGGNTLTVSGAITNGAGLTVNGTLNANSTATALTNSGTLTLASGSNLTLAGSFANSGTVSADTNSTTTYTGTVTANVAPVASGGYGNLTLAKTGGGEATLTGTTLVKGTLTLASNSFANFTGATLNLNGGFTVQSGASFNPDSSTINFETATTASVPTGVAFFNLNINGTNKSLAGPLTVVGALAIGASGQLAAANHPITLYGAFADNNASGGLQTASGSDFTFDPLLNAASNFSLAAASATYGSFTIRNGKSLTTVGSKTFTLGAMNIEAGATLIATGDTFNVSGDWNNLGAYTFDASSTVTLNGAAAQLYRGNFHNLTIANTSASHVVTAATNTSVVGTLALNDGTLAAGASRTHAIGTLTSASGTTLLVDDATNVNVSGVVNMAGAAEFDIQSRLRVGANLTHAIGSLKTTGSGNNGANRVKILRNQPTGYFSMTLTGTIDIEDTDFFFTGNVGGVNGIKIEGPPSSDTPTVNTTQRGLNYVTFVNGQPGAGNAYLVIDTPNDAWSGAVLTGVSFRKPGLDDIPTPSSASATDSNAAGSPPRNLKPSAGEISIDNQDNGSITVEGSAQGSQYMGSGSESGDVDWGTSSADLLTFTATGLAAQRAVRLQWVTASENSNLGFRVLRATSPDGPFELVNDLIPGAGTAATGNTYATLDMLATGESLLNPSTLYYALEDIDFAGLVTRHPPVRVVWLDTLRGDFAEDETVSAHTAKPATQRPVAQHPSATDPSATGPSVGKPTLAAARPTDSQARLAANSSGNLSNVASRFSPRVGTPLNAAALAAPSRLEFTAARGDLARLEDDTVAFVLPATANPATPARVTLRLATTHAIDASPLITINDSALDEDAIAYVGANEIIVVVDAGALTARRNTLRIEPAEGDATSTSLAPHTIEIDWITP